MPDIKVSALPELTEVENQDELLIVDHTGAGLVSRRTSKGTLLKDHTTKTELADHTGNTSNPHGVTKAQVGLSAVPNTDATKRENHTGSQAMATITGLTDALNAKADAAATPTKLTDLDTTVTGAQLDSLKGKVDGIAPGATANDTDANLKNRANHTGTQMASTISDFQTATDARINAQKGASNGLAELDGSGKVPTNRLPAIAITDTFVVANQTAMLALTAQTGDVAIRTDLNKSFILQGSNPAILGHWQEMLTPTDTVTSVAGKTGAVTLTKSDVGLGQVDNTSDATKNSANATLTNKTISGELNDLTAIKQASVSGLTDALNSKARPSTIMMTAITPRPRPTTCSRPRPMTTPSSSFPATRPSLASRPSHRLRLSQPQPPTCRRRPRSMSMMS